MNAPLTYFSAYAGLFASLLLAVVCNAFLDIHYGSFGFEAIFWGVVFGWTSRVGWKQQGQASESGQQKQKIVLLLGAVLSIIIFMPKWGLPRAGLYMLAALQASQNCVTTTRRQLYLGLLVSAVMVMFAAAHYRADWTMLFYLIPYIIAVVFTLVSEQISRRAQDIRQASLGNPSHAGQSLAIASATAIILGLGALLYLATPQLTWPYLEWRYGQKTNLGFLGEGQEQGKSGQPGSANDGQGVNGQNPGGNAGNTTGGDGTGEFSGDQLSPGHGWPSPAEMREAAKRPGMPAWQSETILQMANLDEAISQALAPLKAALQELWERLKAWLNENRSATLVSLFAALLVMLILMLAMLLKEAKVATWLRIRFDYLQLVALARHKNGTAGAIQFYRAMERLFVIGNTPRAANINTREFLREATYYRDDIQREVNELTSLFEQYRYGPVEPDRAQLSQMRALYRTLFQELG